MDDYDKNRDGRLCWDDFAHMVALNFYNCHSRIILPQDIEIQIDEIFNRYDHNRNGTLDFEELIECLQSVFDRLGVNSKANINDVKEFFMDYDKN